MVKRFSYSKYGYLAFALIILLVCWESNKTNAALLGTEIPEEAIRLRILANSDSVQDQAIKRLIRDAIVEEMNTWVSGPASIEEARAVVADHLPEIHGLVSGLLEERGFSYTVKAELGLVDFPTKMYGSQVYPAGEYEALKITIGSGEGQNWWCVLFPPLCFVDLAMGDAVAEPDREDVPGKQGKEAIEQKDTEKGGSQADTPSQDSNENEQGNHPAEGEVRSASLQIESKDQVRFFLVDALQGLFSSVKGWFS